MLLHRRSFELLYRLPKGSGCACRNSGIVSGSSIGSKPRVYHYGFEAGAASRIRDEHHAEYVSGFCRDVLWEGERSVYDVFIEEVDVVAVGVGGVIVEREVASEHGVEDDTTAPDVDCTADVEAFADDELWGGIARAATTSLHEIV